MPPNFEAFVWRAPQGCLALNLHIGSVLSSSPLAYCWVGIKVYPFRESPPNEFIPSDFLAKSSMYFTVTSHILDKKNPSFFDKTSLVSVGIRGQAIHFTNFNCPVYFLCTGESLKKVRIEVLKLKMCEKCQVYLVRSAWSLP